MHGLTTATPRLPGAVAWVRGLLERIEEPMNKLRTMNKSVMDTEEANDIQKLYTSLTASMADYERAAVNAWCQQVCTTILLYITVVCRVCNLRSAGCAIQSAGCAMQ
jgi:hypothetical protein